MDRRHRCGEIIPPGVELQAQYARASSLEHDNTFAHRCRKNLPIHRKKSQVENVGRCDVSYSAPSSTNTNSVDPRFRLDSFVGSARWKRFGANSGNHCGSIWPAVEARMGFAFRTRSDGIRTSTREHTEHTQLTQVFAHCRG